MRQQPEGDPSEGGRFEHRGERIRGARARSHCDPRGMAGRLDAGGEPGGREVTTGVQFAVCCGFAAYRSLEGEREPWAAWLAVLASAGGLGQRERCGVPVLICSG